MMRPEMRTLAIGLLIALLAFIIFWQHCHEKELPESLNAPDVSREQKIIDSLKSANSVLKLNNEILQEQLDSAKKQKIVIYKTFNNEIRQLYSMDYNSLVRLNDSILTSAGLRQNMPVSY